ncbi:MAG: D-glycero-beta-D-manno-heptose 1-phosphate adenylyltransferase [Deltaproteobacteria bacterium]|nr:D-glycero-beta-D-manno-heptose 1-phosphate adenylyltransferase [Deltaproteobacteria bacterium]
MPGKIKDLAELGSIVSKAKSKKKKVVFTNGCFDLLHLGHIHLLREAKKLGDLLVVALNSDSSVKRIKGPGRPILPEAERAELVASLEMVDYVTVFSQPDPGDIIEALHPNVLVKGGDWTADKIIGKDSVEGQGGKVVSLPFLTGHSTTNIIDRIRRE